MSNQLKKREYSHRNIKVYVETTLSYITHRQTKLTVRLGSYQNDWFLVTTTTICFN